MKGIDVEYIKIAKLFNRLNELRGELQNDIIPLIHYLQLNKEDNELADRADEFVAEINDFLSRHTLVIEPKKEKAESA